MIPGAQTDRESCVLEPRRIAEPLATWAIVGFDGQRP